MFTVTEARQFIADNRSFFETSTRDNKAFGDFYLRTGQISLIEDYSGKLSPLLYSATKPYKQGANISVIYDWKAGDFEPALLHAAIRKFLYDNRNHPAILHWNASHNHLVELGSVAIEPPSAPIVAAVQVVRPRSRRPSLLSLDLPSFADPIDPIARQVAPTLFNLERDLQQQSAANLDALPLVTDKSNLLELGELLDSDSTSAIPETVLYRHNFDFTPELPDSNYNLLLIVGVSFAAVSIVTLIVTTLAITSIIHLSTAGTAMLLVTGIGSALAANSLFKSQDSVREPIESGIELPSFP